MFFLKKMERKNNDKKYYLKKESFILNLLFTQTYHIQVHILIHVGT